MDWEALNKDLEEIHTILQKVISETKDELEGSAAISLWKLVRELSNFRYQIFTKRWIK